MFFRKYCTLKSKKSIDEVKAALMGQHINIHNLDFEITQKENVLKMIPHTENEDDKVYTLPITSIKLSSDGQGTILKLLSKPRRIDIGGPYIVMIFVTVATLASLVFLYYGKGEYDNTAYIMLGIAALIFLLLWYRLEQGYFDYIRKIKAWVKSKI
jgi:hypothetical protein